jgi:hypothetical protein
MLNLFEGEWITLVYVWKSWQNTGDDDPNSRIHKVKIFTNFLPFLPILPVNLIFFTILSVNLKPDKSSTLVVTHVIESGFYVETKLRLPIFKCTYELA